MTAGGRQEPAEREAFRHTGEEWRRGNVGRAIFNAFQLFERDLLEAVQRDGFSDIRRVQLNLYRNLDFDGTRLTELAARANMTKQSMQELVDKAEALGLVERRQDTEDRRAKIVVFSDRGLSLLEALHRGIVLAEERLTAAVGADVVQLISTSLNRYCAIGRVAGSGSAISRPEQASRGEAANRRRRS